MMVRITTPFTPAIADPFLSVAPHETSEYNVNDATDQAGANTDQGKSNHNHYICL